MSITDRHTNKRVRTYYHAVFASVVCSTGWAKKRTEGRPTY